MWFTALAHAGRDVWAATCFFLAITILSVAFLIGRFLDRRPILCPLRTPTLLVLFACWSSLVTSYDINSTLLDCWGWTFSAIAGLLLVNVVEEDRQLHVLLRRAGASAIAVAAWALYQQATTHPDSWGHWRIYGSLTNASVLAGFCITWIVLFRPPSRSRLESMTLGASLLALALSRSVWAFLTVAVIGAWDYRGPAAHFGRRYRRSAAVALAACAAIVTALVVHKVTTHTGPYQGNSRFYYWLSALAMARAHPWTGIGLGAFGPALSVHKVGAVQGTLFAHNLPLQVWAETGLFGLLTFTYWLFQLFRRSAGMPQRKRLRLAIAANLLFAMTSVHLGYLVNQLVFALLSASIVLGGERPPERWNGGKLWIGAGAVALILIAPFWARIFAAERIYMAAVTRLREKNTGEAARLLQDAIATDPNNAHSYWLLSIVTGDSRLRAAALSKRRSAMLLDRDTAYALDPSIER